MTHMEIEIEIEIPPYFICPITLQIMKDPVTIPTGITYERESIEEWIFTKNHLTCPATQQTLDPNQDLVTPNITLRRLIQSWCTLHAPDGVQRLPTPKSAVTKVQILKILDQAQKNTLQPQMKCLQSLRSIASHNQTNRRCMESAGVPKFLASLIMKKSSEASRAGTSENLSDLRITCDEALSILYGLQLSELSLKSLNNNAEFIESLALIMKLGNYESRAYAVMLLKSMLDVAEPSMLINLRPEFFAEFRQTLTDQISHSATKATLGTLVAVCPWGRNRIKAVEAGLVHVLIDLLLDSPEKRVSEMMLVVLNSLCQCAEGRAELLKHGAGLAIVSKKILRVSQVGSEKALRILDSVCRHSANPAILHEMLQIGVVAKLCLVVQVESGIKTKERARELLKLHSRAWKNSSCIPGNLISAYPS